MGIESFGSFSGKSEDGDAEGVAEQEFDWKEVIAKGSPSTLVLAVSERKGWSIDKDSFMRLLAKVGEYRDEKGFEVVLKLAKNSLLQEDFLDFMCESLLKDFERFSSAEETVYVSSLYGQQVFGEIFKALASNLSVSEKSLRKIIGTNFEGDVETAGAIQRAALQTLETKTNQ